MASRSHAAAAESLYRLESGRDEDTAWLYLQGDWTVTDGQPASATIGKAIGNVERLVVDGRAIEQSHPHVAAFVYALIRELNGRDVTVSTQSMPDSVAALLELSQLPPDTVDGQASWSPLDWLRYLGGALVGGLASTAALIGQSVARVPALLLGRSQTRWADFIAMIRETGVASLPVVTIVNLLIGAVLGFIGAVQLSAFGADMYLADLVGLASAREMAVIMTAFILAGRVGATFAAHIATMESNEEIDALRMIGVSPFEFLVLPRLVALTLMMPLLYLYGTALAIVGGMLVASVSLGTTFAGFIDRLEDAVALRHFIIGLFKAVAFGILIALTSCHIGMTAGRNAAEVGRAATRTVVICIVGIIAIDAIFAMVTDALNI